MNGDDQSDCTEFKRLAMYELLALRVATGLGILLALVIALGVAVLIFDL